MDGGRIVEDSAPDEIVLSPKLRAAGIREPLYISALKRAGVALGAHSKPGRLDTLMLEESDKAKVRAWAKPSSAAASAPETGHEPLIEVRGVSYSYGKGAPRALDNVSFRLEKGEMAAVVGANGAGKSTLAKLIAGFEQASEGSILYKGLDMRRWSIPERAKIVGYVMQNPNQMLCKPIVFDEVALGLRMRGLADSEVRRRVAEALEICGLARFASWPISALSYGQKKRVTIADALALEPEIIILDEPTAGQDWRHYTDVMEFLAGLNKGGATVLMITHDMHLCIEYAGRALVFAGGRLASDAPAYECLSDPALASAANLRETSLYSLAGLCGIEDAKSLVRRFIEEKSAERAERQ
jgi:energy-coupling factor transport system ATP-binding protein